MKFILTPEIYSKNIYVILNVIILMGIFKFNDYYFNTFNENYNNRYRLIIMNLIVFGLFWFLLHSILIYLKNKNIRKENKERTIK